MNLMNYFVNKGSSFFYYQLNCNKLSNIPVDFNTVK